MPGEHHGLRWVTRTASVGSHGDDRVAVVVHSDVVRIVVADGAGNSGVGGLAAACLVSLAERLSSDWEPTAILRAADAAIVKDNRGAETTGVVLGIRNGRMTGAGVGDSGAWLLFPDDLEHLTSRQRRKPLLGSGSATPVRFEARLEGRLLVATDGLLKYASRDHLIRASEGDLDAAADSLMESVRLPTGALQDDVGLVLAG